MSLVKLINEKTKVKFENVDTLQISQDSKGIFRLNTPLFSYSNKNTPAIVASRKNISTSIERDHFFDIKNNFVLGLSVSEYRRGLKEMHSRVKERSSTINKERYSSSPKERHFRRIKARS